MAELSAAASRAESIAILAVLHGKGQSIVPAVPSRCSFQNPQPERNDYVLPFEAERRLVSTLAFVSSSKDDAEFVPALCIEQCKSLQRVRLWLAVNKTEHNSGDSVLREMKSRFEELAKHLADVQGDKTAAEAKLAIYDSLISICQYRILERLRLSKSSRRSKPQSLVERLKAIVLILSSKRPEQPVLVQGASECLIAHISKVIRLIDAWTKYKTIDQLRMVVDGFHDLSKDPHLKSLLGNIPHYEMEPTSIQALLNITSKMARYRSAADQLYMLAVAYPLLRKLEVVIPKLEKELFVVSPQLEYDSPLIDTLKRHNVRRKDPDIARICQMLRSTKSKLTQDIKREVARSLAATKIHAEVQLLYFREISSPVFPPRVVASSKDACFLCSTLMRSSGQMHQPRTHGRLYIGWRLPNCPSLKRLEVAFDQALDSAVVSSVDRMLIERKRVLHPDPRESTVSTVQSLNSDILQRASRNLLQELPDQLSCGESNASLAPLEAIGEAILRQQEKEVVDAGRTSVRDFSKSEASASIEPKPCRSNTSLVVAKEGIFDLTQGQTLIQHVQDYHRALFRAASHLHLHIEHFARFVEGSASDRARSTRFSIEWLADADAQKVAADAQRLIEGAALSCTDEKHIPVDDAVYIRGRGAVLKIDFL